MQVWNNWQVGFRDVVILDCDNRRQYIFNLTLNDLNSAEDYSALKQLLLEMTCN